MSNRTPEVNAFSISSVTDCSSIAIFGAETFPPGIGPATDRTLRLTDISGESARAPYTRAEARWFVPSRRTGILERLRGWKSWIDYCPAAPESGGVTMIGCAPHAR